MMNGTRSLVLVAIAAVSVLVGGNGGCVDARRRFWCVCGRATVAVGYGGGCGPWVAMAVALACLYRTSSSDLTARFCPYRFDPLGAHAH